MKHTPGKWIVRSTGEVGTKRKLVAVVYPIRTSITGSIERNKANAKLIASAPELLATLERIIRIADEPDLMEYPAGQVDTMVTMAEQAIAKAEGV